jgi:hypothetical protein
MLSTFFSIGDRNYLNNAVVIADALETISKIFGDVTNFRIQFRKPFLSQAEFKLSTEKLDGHIVGHFDHVGIRFYFAYTPVDIVLENKNPTRDDVNTDVTPFNICYHITDLCRGAIEKGFEKIYGSMTTKDKVIFVIFEIPDTSVFTGIMKYRNISCMKIEDAEHLGDRRFRLSVFIGDRLLGYRYSTVKEFNV